MVKGREREYPQMQKEQRGKGLDIEREAPIADLEFQEWHKKQSYRQCVYAHVFVDMCALYRERERGEREVKWTHSRFSSLSINFKSNRNIF